MSNNLWHRIICSCSLFLLRLQTCIVNSLWLHSKLTIKLSKLLLAILAKLFYITTFPLIWRLRCYNFFRLSQSYKNRWKIKAIHQFHIELPQTDLIKNEKFHNFPLRRALCCLHCSSSWWVNDYRRARLSLNIWNN